MKSVLHVDSVQKYFGERLLLHDIYLNCETNQRIALLGRNGSGKSSLLKIIFGSLSASYKYVKVDNKIVRNLFDRRKLINYLPHHSFLPTHLRMKSALSCFCSKDQMEEIMSMDIFKEVQNARVGNLSSGQRRMLETLMLVYSDAKFILLDEPFYALSPIAIEEVKRHIEINHHKGFIIVDHNIEQLNDFCHEYYILDNGVLRKMD